jgi:ribosomal protein S18 acetylase RimI-like enzyme
MLELVEVASREVAGFASFAETAREVHADDPLWVPASEEAVGWAFEESASGRTPLRAWVALQDGTPVARAAALAATGPVGWIGLFASLPGARREAVAVLEACCDALVGWGYGRVEAPRSDPLTIGLQVGGFDAPQTVFTPRHPASYLGHFEAAGFRVAQRMVAPVVTSDRLPVLPARVPGVRVRPIDLGRLDDDLAAFHALQRDVFGGLPGRATRSRAATRRLLDRVLPHMDPDLVLVAERAGAVVGSLLCLPDVWQTAEQDRIDRARIVSIAVRADQRRRGIGLAMAVRLATTLVAKGYRTCEGVWVDEDNRAPLALAERFGARIVRRFAVLARELPAA